MAFDPGFLDELRARVPLGELIGRRVRLIRRGRELVGLCPFHHEKTPSFTVVEDKGFFHCFAGETPVITRNGTRPIAALAGKRAEVLTRSGEWVAAPFKSYGRQKLYRIELSRNGVAKTLYATSGHRWFVRGRKTAVTTTGLRPGHRLEAVLPRPRQRWKLDPAGVRHGIVFGDGTVQRKGRAAYGTINLHGEKAADLAAWFSAYRPATRFRADGIEYLRVYGGRDFGHMKALPAGTEGDAYLLGFLAGYLATDGHVADDGTVMLHCADPEVLRWVRDTATRLGIGTFGVTAQLRKGYLSRDEPIHRIHFVASTMDAAMFLRAEALRRWSGRAKRFERLRWAVISVAPTNRVEDVYCAEVDRHHAFALEDNILTGNCFGCGAHGDAIGFAMQTEGVSFPEAVERLAGEVGLPIPVSTPEERARAAREATLHGVMEAAAQWFEGELRSVRGEAARAYLARRGLDEATIARFRLGYAPDSRSALKSALARAPGGEKIDEAQLVEAGLLIKPEDGGATYDRFRGRVIFPIGDARGRIIAFGGRVLGDGEPKYLNSPDTPLFHKGRVLYNLANAREAARKTGRAIVAEGYMDVIALARAGFAESVAPLGTALTETHLELLWRLCPEPVLCFDGDAAGRRAAARAADRALPILKPGQSLRFALLPAGDDPDSLLAREGRGAVAAALEESWPLDRMLWEIEAGATRLDTPERVAGLEKRLEDRANRIADRKVQYQYLASFRARLREEMWRARGRGPGGPRRVPAQPVAAAGPRHDPAALVRRQEQSLLACLINHPDLLDEFAEALGQIELSEASLDKVRQEILRVCGQASALDSAALRVHLRKAGLAEALAALDGPQLRAHDGFARAGAPVSRARMGLAQILARYRRGAWRVELEEAERAWLENQSETNWARWQELIEASKRAETDASALDDDEFAAPGGTQAS